jgi:HEPN domain-containing protein
MQYAREDLSLAERIVGSRENAARHACFLAQQAAEKAIKAGLVFLRVGFPKIHDLERLHELLPGEWSLDEECEDFEALSDWAVDARYPEDFGDPSWEEAERAVGQARCVVAAIGERLSSASLTPGEDGDSPEVEQ